MKNCQVKKFKMVANTDNLPYYNSVNVKVAQNKDDTLRLIINTSSSVRVFAVGNCTMYNGETVISGNDTVITGEANLYFMNKQEDIKVTIIGLSKLTRLLSYHFDLCEKDVEAFEEEYMPGVYSLLVSNVTGNINRLDKNIHLTSLAIGNSPLLTGDMKNLLSGLWQNGKRTTMELYFNNIPNVTNVNTHIGDDYTHRGEVRFFNDDVTYPNGWVIKVPYENKWYDSNGNEIPAP